MILDQIANFTTDLMGFDATKVIIGRTNFINVNFEDNIILIDMLTTNPVGRASKYNSVLEKMEYQVLMKGIVTISFYGSDSFNNAAKFITMMESEEAMTSAYTNSITYRFPTRIQNTGELTGTIHHEKYEIEMIVNYVHKTERSVMSIETSELTFLIDS